MASKTETHELSRLRAGLRQVLASDNFISRRLRAAGLDSSDDLRSPADLGHLPLMSRAELVVDQAEHPPFGSNLTQPLKAYVRHTSSSGEPPLQWLATREDLEWLTTSWRTALATMGVRAGDRVALQLDTSPSGWLEAVDTVPALSLSSNGSLATVLLCTPTQALRLQPSPDLRLVLLSGEPGANVPSTRRRIEDRLGAQCVNLYASMELGPIGWECPESRGGIHLNEQAFIVESAAVDGAPPETSELVLTSLGRWGMPRIRYRTGDLVRLRHISCACGSGSVWADGGVLGRVDDLLEVRGVKLLPSSVENVVRRHPAVADYRLRVYEVRGACELVVEVEPDAAIATEGDRARVAVEVAEDLRRSFGIRLPCEAVATGSMPRDSARPRRIARRKAKHVAL